MKRTLIAVAALAILTVLVIFLVVRMNSSRLQHDSTWATTAEVTPITLPLTGDVASANIEFSGLTWLDDQLILLPQYPNRFGNTLYAINKADILDLIDSGSNQPLTPTEIDLGASGIYELTGFEGLESIVFIDTTMYVTIEASPSAMQGYIVQGEVAAEGDQLLLDDNTLKKIDPQTDVSNYSEETMTVINSDNGDQLLTIYEANGSNLNSAPKAHLFNSSLDNEIEIPFPNIEYRVTDATAVDENGRFWVINYAPQQSINKLDPAVDPLFATYGIGPTHAENNVVERLIELEYTGNEIILADTPPIQLQLLGDDEARNWEGIVRLDDRGFLLVTDKFPETILAFIPYEE